MLVARENVHLAIVNLLLEAIRDIHGKRGYFAAANEFPSIERVDIRVSPDAVRHHRFGPSLLYRYMPFWAATTLEAVHHHRRAAARRALCRCSVSCPRSRVGACVASSTGGTAS